MYYNIQLIEVNSQLGDTDESRKKKTVHISEKNLEIAHKYYGNESIYTLKYELAHASNCIVVSD